jgi:hypothetical protein
MIKKNTLKRELDRNEKTTPHKFIRKINFFENNEEIIFTSQECI